MLSSTDCLNVGGVEKDEIEGIQYLLLKGHQPFGIRFFPR